MEVILPAKEVPPDLLEYFEPVDIGGMKDVLTINPGSYKEAHFATFPPALVEPCIKAGTSERGVCGAKITKLRLKQDLSPQKQQRAIEYLESKGLI